MRYIYIYIIIQLQLLTTQFSFGRPTSQPKFNSVSFFLFYPSSTQIEKGTAQAHPKSGWVELVQVASLLLIYIMDPYPISLRLKGEAKYSYDPCELYY